MAEFLEFPSEKTLLEIDDLFTSIEIADKFGVNIEGRTTIEEIRERLILEARRRYDVCCMKQIQEAMQQTEEENKTKRVRLIEMFEDLMNIVGLSEDRSKSELIRDLLEKDQTAQNLVADCNAKVDLLRQHQCHIVIAGETGAGKSTLLNLLLGDDILPRHVLSCTSVITTLRYDPKAHAKIIYGEPNPCEVVLENLDNEGKTKLKEIAFKGSAKDRTGHNIQEVQVFLPIDFLKCGIVLVDTPGVGENEFLEQYILDFISKNEILGFLYIIQSDTAGGVQEDRLLKLIKMIIDQQKHNTKALDFDPKTALFVANKFDNIPADDKERVKDHILRTLKKHWPEFDNSMVMFFSAGRALQDVEVHQEYINDEYKQLLQKLSSLYYRAKDRRIRSSYRWMETVVKRISHFLNTTVTHLGWTKRRNKERSAEQSKKLQILREKSDTVINELTADLNIKCSEIVGEIQKYLGTPQARYLICSTFGNTEFQSSANEIRDERHWEWIKRNIEDAFYDRLFNALEEYNVEMDKVSIIETGLTEQMKLKLGLLEHEIFQAEFEISSTRSSTYTDPSRRAFELIKVPVKLSLQARCRVFKNPIKDFLKSDLGEFQKDPVSWTRQRNETLLRKLLENESSGREDGMLTILVRGLLQRPYDILQAMQQKIPSIIEANLKLLSDIQNTIVRDKQNAKKYRQMMVEIENLMNYGEGYIFLTDFKSNEIKILQQNPGGVLAVTFRVSELVLSERAQDSKFYADPHGLWTVVRQGEIRKQGDERPISIKMYKPSSGMKNAFQEIAKLRRLLSEDTFLATFLGIYHTDVKCPAYVFEGHFETIEHYFASHGLSAELLGRLLIQTAEGINYLHQKEMVHMELTGSTVTVTADGDVRLTGACLPRKASLPLDLEQPARNFVYLSPEVLNKELYTTSADVYGFGILVYEMASKTNAFREMKEYPFREFVRVLDPCALLQFDTQTELTEDAQKLVKLCVQISETLRPSMNVVLDRLKEINGNFRQEGPQLMVQVC